MVTSEAFHELMVNTNIILQVVAVVLLLGGILLKKRMKYAYHADIMFLALLVNLVQLVGHMIPSMVYILGGLVPIPYNAGTVIVILHAATGFIAEVIGAYILVGWAFIYGSMDFCFGRKKLMRWTAILWVVSFALGMLYYIVHIVIY